MSNLYEHLIRRFGAEVNEGAEDFMTPREVVPGHGGMLDRIDSVTAALPVALAALTWAALPGGV